MAPKGRREEARPISRIEREADFASEEKLSRIGALPQDGGLLRGPCTQTQEWVTCGCAFTGELCWRVTPHLLQGPFDGQQSSMPCMSEREEKEVSG